MVTNAISCLDPRRPLSGRITISHAWDANLGQNVGSVKALPSECHGMLAFSSKRALESRLSTTPQNDPFQSNISFNHLEEVDASLTLCLPDPNTSDGISTRLNDVEERKSRHNLFGSLQGLEPNRGSSSIAHIVPASSTLTVYKPSTYIQFVLMHKVTS
jgi:hypothetical protein